jgi:hypothetical protein
MHGAIMRPRAPEVYVVGGDVSRQIPGWWVPGRDRPSGQALRGGGPRLMSQVESRKSEVGKAELGNERRSRSG